MDDWKKLSEALLPEKKDFYCISNMEDITHAGYRQEKRAWVRTWDKTWDIYHNLCIQDNKVLLFDTN